MLARIILGKHCNKAVEEETNSNEVAMINSLIVIKIFIFCILLNERLIMKIFKPKTKSLLKFLLKPPNVPLEYFYVLFNRFYGPTSLLAPPDKLFEVVIL